MENTELLTNGLGPHLVYEIVYRKLDLKGAIHGCPVAISTVSVPQLYLQEC